MVIPTSKAVCCQCIDCRRTSRSSQIKFGAALLENAWFYSGDAQYATLTPEQRAHQQRSTSKRWKDLGGAGRPAAVIFTCDLIWRTRRRLDPEQGRRLPLPSPCTPRWMAHQRWVPAVFSTCFGHSFLPRPAIVPPSFLIGAFGSGLLINTGWTSGAFPSVRQAHNIRHPWRSRGDPRRRAGRARHCCIISLDVPRGQPVEVI